MSTARYGRIAVSAQRQPDDVRSPDAEAVEQRHHVVDEIVVYGPGGTG